MLRQNARLWSPLFHNPLVKKAMLRLSPTYTQWQGNFEVDDYPKEINKEGRALLTLPLLLKFNRDLLLKELLPPIPCQSNQPRPEKEQGGRFWNRGARGWNIGFCQGSAVLKAYICNACGRIEPYY
jgi:hypothetical protein